MAGDDTVVGGGKRRVEGRIEVAEWRYEALE